MAAASGVPVIDMQDFAGVAEKLVQACEEWGCFRLINHGVSEKLMSEAKAVTLSLLDLPPEIKMRNASPVEGKGYTPPNHASPFFEGMSIYDMASPGAVDDFCNQLGASAHHREILFKYSQALYDLAQDLGAKLLQGLGLHGDLFNGWPCQMKLNKYNYSPQSVGQTGAVMHSDPGFLTILQDDEIIGGLEAVSRNTGELVPVDPMPGTLVINVGDIAKVWSNGRFCNVKHRVQCYEAKIRTSIALFVLGPRDAKVETRHELVDSEHPNLYVPFDFEEYRTLRTTTKAPTGGALELFRASNL
ncbi:hypothetical protein RJ639_041114 [Escallonia herrerae]|uniref:2-oxoglutarate-dependent dioxygenase DAO n=1 Tax=Escallonia herrerae TaxID=1293975 RepID=A0AA88WLI1_9ASTE|nr:hypothetical protein RJ639_041113 [Escallonia herrerae]KAK3027293.1 hypothetical protein RJ639_041114 [Escallonia herrerae]